MFTDKINIIQCPLCGTQTRAPASLMYVDLKRGFVVWYEPSPDSMIDNELPMFASIFGGESCYVTAPRVSDWNEFKATIQRFEHSELKAKPPSMKNSRAAMQSLLRSMPKKKQGCLGAFILAVGVISIAGVLSVRLLV